MMRESTDFLARVLAAEGDTQSAQAVKRAFMHGGYTAVVGWRLATLLERAKSHYVSPVDEAELYAEVSDREEDADAPRRRSGAAVIGFAFHSI